jgi:hypothetical protein
VCLIRLQQIRPRFVPKFLGISSENAAHRIAVEWRTDGQLHEGVYIPRRDTSSKFNSLVGGRLFPGVHHHAHFDVDESEENLRVELNSDDGITHIAIEGRLASELPTSSVFHSIAEASAFFERGTLGYSTTSRPGEFDGLELRCHNWHVQPLDVGRVESSYFEDTNRFPKGAAQFDCALLMRRIEHEWLGRESLYGDCCT